MILDEKIEELKGQMGLQAIKYSDYPKIQLSKQDILQQKVEKLIEIEMRKDVLQTKLDGILQEQLYKIPYNILKVAYLRVVEGLKWEIISKKLNYSRSQCWRLFNVAKKL